MGLALLGALTAIAAGTATVVLIRNSLRSRDLDVLVESIRRSRNSAEEGEAVLALWMWAGERDCRYTMAIVCVGSGEAVDDENVDEVSGPVEVRMTFLPWPGSTDYFRYDCRFLLRDPMNVCYLYRSLPPRSSPVSIK